jgi:hypothetical protein
MNLAFPDVQRHRMESSSAPVRLRNVAHFENGSLSKRNLTLFLMHLRPGFQRGNFHRSYIPAIRRESCLGLLRRLARLIDDEDLSNAL